MPQFDHDDFNQPFAHTDHDKNDRSMAIDELQATKLIDELAKINDENENFQTNLMNDDDSDDLLSSEVHLSGGKLAKIDEEESPDSPSNQLPVPPKEIEKDIQPYLGAA